MVVEDLAASLYTDLSDGLSGLSVGLAASGTPLALGFQLRSPTSKLCDAWDQKVLITQSRPWTTHMIKTSRHKSWAKTMYRQHATWQPCIERGEEGCPICDTPLILHPTVLAILRSTCSAGVMPMAGQCHQRHSTLDCKVVNPIAQQLCA